ncbi:MAG: transporter substrate-binding domain-containing protein [Spirochaetales bacterium]|uniref:Transporter substrate-binding domain-containing protein n=1 Tax=Candidatus Thalassospirochaeta sargassi TaxID=3119039 RepID=A0AAJ1IA03_9SPIO|nr:transporter substrate-binding domain-containing protein [Spirochaetales bacterium]
MKQIKSLILPAAALFFLLISCSTPGNYRRNIPETDSANYSIPQRAAEVESAEERAEYAFETVVPGVLSIGYTDIYVDGYLNQGEDGPDGLDSALAVLLAKELGLEPEFTLVPAGDDYFESIVAALNGYKVDMFISITAVRPERESLVLFSVPYTFEGEELGISFQKYNDALKTAVDPLIEKMINRGTVKKLRKEFLSGVDDIYQTNKVMREIEGSYFVSSHLINGEERYGEGINMVDISYDKQWIEYDYHGIQSAIKRIISAEYGRISLMTVEGESSSAPEASPSSLVYLVEKTDIGKKLTFTLDETGYMSETLEMISIY